MRKPVTDPKTQLLRKLARAESGNQQAGQAALTSVNPRTIRWPNVSHCSRLPGA
jgi:hypothetical protein